MKFLETALTGVFEITIERKADERGFFARTWCREEFAKLGLETRLVQCSVSQSTLRGTLRGMHYQAAPFAETKLVRCTFGRIYDVVLDLRPDKSTFKKWIPIELTAAKRNMVYVPEGCAHGFLTLEDDCEVFYQMSEFHHPEGARGVRWNDPAFGIDWPGKVEAISTRDASYPDFA